MPIAGLVLTLAERPDLADSVIGALRVDARIVTGDRMGARLPIVVETRTVDEGETVFEELGRTPGVLQVELAFYDFSDVDDFGSGPRPRRRRRLPTVEAN